jgi:hypothetical protein
MVIVHSQSTLQRQLRRQILKNTRYIYLVLWNYLEEKLQIAALNKVKI